MSEQPSLPTRRDFFGRLGFVGAAALVVERARRSGAAEVGDAVDFPPPENLAARGEVPRRKFGGTDAVVSAIGLSGHTFATAKSEAEAIHIVLPPAGASAPKSLEVMLTLVLRLASFRRAFRSKAYAEGVRLFVIAQADGLR
jgi:hypothetical protein